MTSKTQEYVQSTNPPSCASPTTRGKKAFTPRILLLATALARAEHTTKHTGQPFRVMSFDIIRAFHAPGNRLTSRLGPLARSPRQVFHPPPPTAGDLYPTPSSSSALRRCPFLLLPRRRGQGTWASGLHSAQGDVPLASCPGRALPTWPQIPSLRQPSRSIS